MSASLGVKRENHQLTNLPQHLAERFGWEEMAFKISPDARLKLVMEW